MGTSAANRAFARRAWDEWFNAHDPRAAQRFFSPAFVNHALPGAPPGPASMVGLIRILEDAFPDFCMRIDDEIAEGDRVVHRTTFTGTHTGPFYGLDATGKRIEETHAHIFRFEDGLIAEHWGIRHELPTVLHLGGRVVSP